MKKLVLVCFLLLSGPALALDFGVDLYARSYHHELPQGKRAKLNESNIGYGLHASKTWGDHTVLADVGAFQNSYYDQAFWVGVQYRYRVFKYLEVGYMVRHWETAHETYPDKSYNDYLTVAVPVTERVRVWAYGGQNGGVLAVGLEF